MTEAWIKEFEGKVEAVVSELGSLRKSNASLKKQVDKLKGQLAAKGPDKEWAAEKKQIRTRVNRMVKNLEKVL